MALASTRGPNRFEVRRICYSPLIPMIICLTAAPWVNAQEDVSRWGLVREALDAHRQNLGAIRTIEGEALMTVYTRIIAGPGQVEDVTQYVAVRYAWDKESGKRFSEHEIADCFVGDCRVPISHPRWVSMRDLIDRESHVRVAYAGRFPRAAETQPSLLAVISPLESEVEVTLNELERNPKVGVAYDGFSADFDIRYYFHLGQDVHQLLKGWIEASEKDPLSVEHIDVDLQGGGDQRILRIEATYAAKGGRGQRVSTYHFDMEKAGSLVYKQKTESGTPTWEYSEEYEYLKVPGVWFPSKARVRRWAVDAQAGEHILTKDVEARFLLCTRINQPWSNPDLFSLAGLGIKAGDKVIDRITGEDYVFPGR